MKIKLIQEKNVYGVRQPVGKVLISGKTIPDWQAAEFLRLGIAEAHKGEPVKKKRTKSEDGGNA